MPGTDELPIKYTDIMRGETHRVKVRYGELSQFVKDKIDAVDLTEHELLEMIVITMNKINIHLMAGSDIDLTEDDISWP